jgi:hypothetical protein
MKLKVGIAALLVAGLSFLPAQAQNTRSQLQLLINTYITTNGVGGITGAILNSVLNSFIASAATLADANIFSKGQTITTGPNALENCVGSTLGLFFIYNAYGWEECAGTSVAPIVTAGSSLKVSRTEDLSDTVCSNTFNDNSCNSAIYGATQNVSGGSGNMQINGVLGTALTYSSSPQGEAVGVQGLSRAVGAAIAGIAGGYFEARYDSTQVRPYYYTVGVEARSGNLSGLDAVLDVNDGNSFNSFLATCGEGTFTAQKCNSALSMYANDAQFLEGVIAGAGCCSRADFDAESSSTYALIFGGNHTYQIFGNNWSVNGAGDLDIFTPDSNQAFFESTGPNRAFISMNNRAGGQGDTMQFNDAGVVKFNLGLAPSDSFFMHDNVNSADFLDVSAGGNVSIGESGKNTTIFGALFIGAVEGSSCGPGAPSSSWQTSYGITIHC